MCRNTRACLFALYKNFHCAPFLATSQAEDSASFSCLGEQRAFCKGVRQKKKDKQFVVPIVLPANSQDLAVPPKQLPAGQKDTF